MSKASDFAAWYAAVIATGALALEVRRWVESGVRLSLTIIPEARSFDEEDEATYVAVAVTNRGTQPTTITHMAVVQFGNLLNRIRAKPKGRVLWVASNSSGIDTQFPSLLNPGGQWFGRGKYSAELEEWLAAEKTYILIQASHRKRPYFSRIKRPEKTSNY